MNKFNLIIKVFLLFSYSIFGQKDIDIQSSIQKSVDEIQLQTDVHQPLVVDAYDLLLLQEPEIEYSVMNNYIGTNQTDGPWTQKKVVVGAYREDIEEIVYRYNFSIFSETISHFWQADPEDGGGDLSTITIENIENAYQKARVYIYGIDEWGNDRIFINKPLSANIVGWFLSYESLFDLYNTGKYWVNGYIDLSGNIVNNKLGPYYMAETSRNTYVWEILGRVTHLLGDMGVPAHAHNDLHIEPDGYEDGYMDISIAIQYTEAMAMNDGGMLRVYNKCDPLRYLFYTVNQVADFFDSDGAAFGIADYGDNDYDPYFGNDYYAELDSKMQELGTPNRYNNYPKIARNAYIMSMRAIAGLLHWFAIETDMLPLPPPSANITYPTYCVGSGRMGDPFYGSFTITNASNISLFLKIQAPYWGVDLEGQTDNHLVYKWLMPCGSTTISYSGDYGIHNYGPFTQTITIDDNNNNIHKIHTIIGTRLLPDFCYGETQAKSSSPEEQLFDGAFLGYFGKKEGKFSLDKSKSIRERLDFAYNLLERKKTEKVEDVCKTIIELYPESEMGISFYAMGLLWEAAYSDEAPEFNEKDYREYLKELTTQKNKYKINGYAQLILSLLDVGKDIKGLERLFTDYKYDGLKELALFHQFIHYFVYESDKELARKISDRLDEMFKDSRYGYQAHLIFGDKGFTQKGLLELVKKQRKSLLEKRAEIKTDMLSELPTVYRLYNNYPNPFNPTTTIKYSVPKVSTVKLSVYNMMGQLVKTLVDGTKAPGFYNVEWNGTNENNSKVTSGIYFYRFESGNFVSNNKMILLK